MCVFGHVRTQLLIKNCVQIFRDYQEDIHQFIWLIENRQGQNVRNDPIWSSAQNPDITL